MVGRPPVDGGFRMAADPLPHELVHDPLAGDEQGDTIRLQRSQLREEEDALLRRKFDAITVFAAGPANVVIQLAWPEVGYGVVESKVESGQVFRHPVKRFRTTIGYLGVAMFGSPGLRDDFRRAVNEQHRQVRSGPDSPVKYNAFNRELQLWVASSIYYGARDAIVRMHGPLSAHEEEVLLRAGSRWGTTLQVPADMWHRDVDAFWEYWEAGIERCDIPPPVAEYFHALLGFQIFPRPLDRFMASGLRWLNIGFIPGELRDQLGLEWTAKDEARLNRLMRAIGFVSRPLPHVVRMTPINLMMWNLGLRRRLGRPLV